MEGKLYASAHCQQNLNGECLTDPDWCEADIYPHCGGGCPGGWWQIGFSPGVCYCSPQTCWTDKDCKYSGKGPCGRACYKGGCFQRQWLAGKV